jgi:hypothetical protein
VPSDIGTTGNIPVNAFYGILNDPSQYGVADRAITLAVDAVTYTQTDGKSVEPLNQTISSDRILNKSSITR